MDEDVHRHFQALDWRWKWSVWWSSASLVEQQQSTSWRFELKNESDRYQYLVMHCWQSKFMTRVIKFGAVKSPMRIVYRRFRTLPFGITPTIPYQNDTAADRSSVRYLPSRVYPRRILHIDSEGWNKHPRTPLMLQSRAIVLKIFLLQSCK